MHPLNFATTIYDETLADSIDVEVTCEIGYDGGAYVEPGHPYNGSGAGWYVDHIEARQTDGTVITLTERQIDSLIGEALDRRDDWEQAERDLRADDREPL